MVPQYLVVRGDDYTATAKVIETYEHRGDTFARVRVDPFAPRQQAVSIVEVPDDPETPDYELQCTECGHEEELPNGETERVGDKHHRCQHRSNAELHGRIHEAQTGHDTQVEVMPA